MYVFDEAGNVTEDPEYTSTTAETGLPDASNIDWYDQFLWDIGIDPSSTSGINQGSPTNEQLEQLIGSSASPLSFFSNLLKGTSSLGTAGQMLGLAGLGKFASSILGGGGGGGYAGYKGGIPQLTASRTMNPIPTKVTTPEGAVVPRRPGSGGITYFTPMTYSPTAVTAAPAAPAPVPPTEPSLIALPPEDNSVAQAAGGGIMGAASRYNLGGYSDGGRLLRGPGDGVSDDIPATIGDRQPARLADGEFVVPARIVSELGNGSTEAGARKLYAMMDRVKKSRMKSKKNIAADSNADKHLPA